MNSKSLFFLVSLLFCSCVKSIEPFTVVAVGAGAMTMRAFFKSTVGKVFVGYALGRIAATPTGKYLISQAQNAILKKQMDAAAIRLQVMKTNMGLLSSKFGNMLRTQETEDQMLHSFTQESVRCSEKINGSSSASSSSAWQNGRCRSVRFEQTNIRQEINMNQGSSFVVLNANADKEREKKQFWKGMLFGFVGGAGIMGWYDKKREDRMIAYLFSVGN